MRNIVGKRVRVTEHSPDIAKYVGCVGTIIKCNRPGYGIYDVVVHFGYQEDVMGLDDVEYFQRYELKYLNGKAVTI